MDTRRRQSARLALPRDDIDVDPPPSLQPHVPSKTWSKRPRADTTNQATSRSTLKPVPKKSRTSAPDAVESGANPEDKADMEIDSQVGRPTEATSRRPSRSCITNAAPPPKKAIRRTTAQVDRMNREYNEKADKIDKMEAVLAKMLASFELAQEANEQAEVMNTITEFSQELKRLKQQSKISDDDDSSESAFEVEHRRRSSTRTRSDFDREIEDGGDQDSGSEGDGGLEYVEEQDNQTKLSKKKRKAARGEERAKINELKTQMRDEREEEQMDTDDVAVKKKKIDLSTVKRPSHLSGINKHWSKETKRSHHQLKNPKPSKSALSDDEVIGGFIDDDVASAPPPRSLKSKHRDKKVVVVIESSDSEPAPTPVKKVPTKHTKVKKEVKPVEPPTATDDDRDTVPEFLEQQKKNGLWHKVFLPTLYGRLFASKNPFDDFASRSDSLLKVVKEVLRDTVPGNTYVPTKKSKILELAYDRLTDKRSLFGSQALKVVDQFFKKGTYQDNPEAIAQYVAWALEKHGPGVWASPIPQDHNVPEGWQPQGLFESEFVIKTLAPLLFQAKGSAVDHGNPIGAVALAAAAVERAFDCYQTGRKKVPASKGGHFSMETSGGTVDDYVFLSRKFSQNAWDRIQKACAEARGADGDVGEIPPSVSVHSIKRHRRDLYIPSSP